MEGSLAFLQLPTLVRTKESLSSATPLIAILFRVVGWVVGTQRRQELQSAKCKKEQCTDLLKSLKRFKSIEIPGIRG